MIKKVVVENFRNIKNGSYDLEGKTNLFVGQNKLGKSNLLNAINWLVADCLLTDKYGAGENDIDSIFPIDMKDNESVSVTIVNENGVEFTKTLKPQKSRATGKVNGKNPDYYVNGVKQRNKGVFYDVLYTSFGYTPKFTKLKVDEVKLNTNPYYALLNIDYKALRELLVACGCSVTNEEIYAAGFQDMKQYEAKYLGKFSDMRKALKAQDSIYKDQEKRIEGQEALYNGVEKVDPEELAALKEELKQLYDRRSNLKDFKTKEEITKLENEKANIDLKMKEVSLEFEKENTAQIQSLQADLRDIKSEWETGLNKALVNVEKELADKQAEINTLNRDLANANMDASKLKNELLGLQQKGTMTKGLINDKNSQLTSLIMGSEFEFVCPDCGNVHKVKSPSVAIRIQKVTDEIKGFETELELQKQTYINKKKEKEHADSVVRNLSDSIHIKETEYGALKEKKETVLRDYQETIDRSKAEDIEIKLAYLRTDKPDLSAYEARKNEINAQITDLETKGNDLVKVELESVNLAIQACENNINALYAKQNDYEKKLEVEETHKSLKKIMADNLWLLERTNAFIQEMIKRINEKAKEITGFDFVMLEENQTNDSLTEVCYATVDGVPFKDLNTADKIKYGIEFIENLRKLNPNELPILVDRLEGVDTLEHINSSTKYQIIGTRVNDSDKSIKVVTL